MKRIILTFGLVLTALALFSQIPRIRLNQVQKDTLWGSVLISSPVDSNLTYSRDFYIGPDTSLNFYGTVLVAGGGGGGGSFVTTTILSDSLANYILKVAGFGGDVTGTYDNIIVTDDSHNHIISNVDGLQTALDSKLSAEVDGSVTNEGSLSVGAGGANSSTINSNTSGSTAVTIEGGTDITITESGSTITIASTAAGGGGTVTSVDIAAGTGISVSGSPITTSGTITVTNSAPDQTVSLTGAGINAVTGTYPNFTITGTEVDGSTTNELQTISTSGAAGNISLSNGGGTLNLNVNDADASATNEGSLTVGAGGANSSDIVSNTSGSTNVTIAGGSNVTVTESGSTITISATGGGSSFNNLTETADTVFVAKYLNVDTSTLYVDAINNRVGIGRTAPTEALDVNGEIKGNAYILDVDSSLQVGGSYLAMDFIHQGKANDFSSMLSRMIVYSDYAINTPALALQRFRGSKTNPLKVLANDRLGSISFGGASGNPVGIFAATAVVEAYADADATDTESPARLSFVTGSTFENRTERLTVKSDGKVGVGTTTPLSKFHIAQETSTLNPLARIGVHTVQPFAVDNIVYGSNGFYNNDSLSFVSIETGRVAWFQQFCGSSIFRGSIDTILTTQKVTNQVTQAAFTPFGLHVIPLGNAINDNPNLSAENVAQYNYYKNNLLTVKDSLFVIDSLGKVGVGTSAPTESLDVNGNARFRVIGNATRTGALSYTSTGVLTTNTSDIRLKTNLQPIESVLNYINEFVPYTFNWINDANVNDFGFIAQDVEQIYPLLVFENQGMKGVHYDKLGVLAIKAIQEQQAIIESQKTEIDQLKTQYNDLLQRIIQLENK